MILTSLVNQLLVKRKAFCNPNFRTFYFQILVDAYTVFSKYLFLFAELKIDKVIK